MKKLKFALLLSGLLLTTTAAEAKKDIVTWGAKLTVDAERPTKWHFKDHSFRMFHNGVGFTLGAVANFDLGHNMSLEPGLSFFYSKYNYDLVLGYESNMEKDPPFTKIGFQLPVLFGYTFNFSDHFGLRLYTGPQVRWAFGGSIGIKDPQVKKDYETLLLWESNRRFDCSWKFGIGFPIYNFMISAEADLGMTNMAKGSTITGNNPWVQHENRIGAGVTYYFK